MADNELLLRQIEETDDEWERQVLLRILSGRKAEDAKRAAAAEAAPKWQREVWITTPSGEEVPDHEVTLRRKSCTRCFAEGTAKRSYSKTFETLCGFCERRFVRTA